MFRFKLGRILHVDLIDLSILAISRFASSNVSTQAQAALYVCPIADIFPGWDRKWSLFPSLFSILNHLKHLHVRQVGIELPDGLDQLSLELRPMPHQKYPVRMKT